MPNFGWAYPPGVTGNEPEIAGTPLCPSCRDADLDREGNCECGFSQQTEADCAAEAKWEAEREARADTERGGR